MQTEAIVESPQKSLSPNKPTVTWTQSPPLPTLAMPRLTMTSKKRPSKVPPGKQGMCWCVIVVLHACQIQFQGLGMLKGIGGILETKVGQS